MRHCPEKMVLSQNCPNTRPTSLGKIVLLSGSEAKLSHETDVLLDRLQWKIFSTVLKDQKFWFKTLSFLEISPFKKLSSYHFCPFYNRAFSPKLTLLTQESWAKVLKYLLSSQIFSCSLTKRSHFDCTI